MTSQEATLIVASVAAVASLLTLILGSRLTYDRERRQALVRKEIDRMFAVEEMAGELAELVGKYRRVWSGIEETRLQTLFTDLEATAGRLSRYPELRQALRDVSNVCQRLFVAVRDHNNDEREIRGEVDPALQKLHQAVDRAIGSRSLAS